MHPTRSRPARKEALHSRVMDLARSFQVGSLLFALACGDSSVPANSNKSDPAVGGVGGATITHGSSSSSDGKSNGGQLTTTLGGTLASGGNAASGNGSGSGNGALAGSVGGGNAASGSSSGAMAGSSSGANTFVVAGAGGFVGAANAAGAGPGPAADTLGQDPFLRSATSGVLVTSSDGMNATELVLAPATDGGVFVAGATRDPRVMGLKSFDAEILSEAFVARLDEQGQRLWAVPLAACGVPVDIASLASVPSVYVLCGYEPNHALLTPSTCNSSALVECLSGNEGIISHETQVKIPASAVGGRFCPHGLGVDPSGRSYVGGAFSDLTQIQRVMLTAITSTGQQDWSIISSGSMDTSRDFPAAYPSDVDVDVNGNAIFAGAFNNWLKLGVTQLTSQAVSGQYSMYNGFIGSISNTASSVKVWQFGGTVFDVANAIKPTKEGGFVVGGSMSSSGGIGGKVVAASQEGSGFIAQFGSDGQAAWTKVLAGKGAVTDLAIASDGRVYFVGSFEKDELFYSYDPTTDELVTHRTVLGSRRDNELYTNSIAISTTGAIWIAGTFKGSIDLGAGMLTTGAVSAFLWRAD